MESTTLFDPTYMPTTRTNNFVVMKPVIKPTFAGVQKANVTCYGCGQVGHYRSSCPKGNGKPRFESKTGFPGSLGLGKGPATRQ